MRRAVWAGRIWRRGEEELFVKAAPMTQKPAFRLMKLGDVQSVYHLQMPRWLFTDPRYTALSLEAKVAYTFLLNRFQLSRLNGWINEIAQGLAGLVHIFNPQLILIGGGVSAQQALLIDPLAAQVRKSIMPAFAEGLEVRAAALQNDAGLVGAVYYFKQQQ